MEAPIARVPKWQRVYLVCKACHGRGNGPKQKAKSVVSTLRELVRAARPRARVLTTGCLGLCPRKASAIAVVGRDAPRLYAVASRAQLAGIVAEPVRDAVDTVDAPVS